jgi:hypothetical protein
VFDLAGALHREPGRARAGAAESTDRAAATRQAVPSRRRPVVGPAGAPAATPTLRTQGTKAVKDEDQGEFWMPLSDVTRRFDKVVVQ